MKTFYYKWSIKILLHNYLSGIDVFDLNFSARFTLRVLTCGGKLQLQMIVFGGNILWTHSKLRLVAVRTCLNYFN